MKNGLVKIWRVENARGNGPYRKAKYAGILDELTSTGFNQPDDKRRPDPLKDKRIAEIFNRLNEDERLPWVFGFRSLKQYRSWFNTKAVRTLLHERGFFLTRYEVDPEKVIRNGHQVLFMRQKASITGFRNCHGESPEPDNQPNETPLKQSLIRKNALTVACHPASQL